MNWGRRLESVRRDRTEAKVRANYSVPVRAMPAPSGERLLTIEAEGVMRELAIPEHLAAELLAGGLAHGCDMHGLHLNPWRLWTTDDVERLLVAAQSK